MTLTAEDRALLREAARLLRHGTNDDAGIVAYLEAAARLTALADREEDRPRDGHWRVDAEFFYADAEFPDGVVRPFRLPLRLVRDAVAAVPPVPHPDTERLDWLENRAATVRPNMTMDDDDEVAWRIAAYDTGATGEGGTLRAAIDAARHPEGTQP